MNVEEARLLVGQLVMSKDAGHKLIKCLGSYHGPYKLLKVTRSGLCILEGREEFRVRCSLLSLVNEK